MTKYPDLVQLGKILRMFRNSNGFSQEKLAELSELHLTYIGSVERGERNPSFRSLNRVLSSLSISWTKLGEALD